MSALDDLLLSFRVESDDAVAPFLWDDDYVLLVAKDAQCEAAQRALLIEDDESADVCDIEWEAGWTKAPLHPSIIKVRAASWNGRFLTGVSREALNERYPMGWSQIVSNSPREFIDPQQRYLTLLGKPTVDGSVHLSVYRRPILDLEDGFEITEHLVPKLLNWMLHRAYGKRDSDGYDANLSAKHEAMFTADFGEALDANVLRTQRNRESTTIVHNPTW